MPYELGANPRVALNVDLRLRGQSENHWVAIRETCEGVLATL